MSVIQISQVKVRLKRLQDIVNAGPKRKSAVKRKDVGNSYSRRCFGDGIGVGIVSANIVLIICPATCHMVPNRNPRLNGGRRGAVRLGSPGTIIMPHPRITEINTPLLSARLR